MHVHSGQTWEDLDASSIEDAAAPMLQIDEPTLIAEIVLAAFCVSLI